jgi:hypothetical protein
MGTAKQLLEVCGQLLIACAASVALEAGCLPVVVVVTGANAATSRESLRGLDVREAENHSGMGDAAAVSCYTNVSSVNCPRGSLYSIPNERAPITSTVALKNLPRAQ